MRSWWHLGLAAALAAVSCGGSETPGGGDGGTPEPWDPPVSGWYTLGDAVSVPACMGYGAAVAIDPYERPVVAWRDCQMEIVAKYCVRRYDHGRETWQDLGSCADGGATGIIGGLASGPALAVGADGTVLVAWSVESSGTGSVRLVAWDERGGAWVERDGSRSLGVSRTSGVASMPALAVDAAGNIAVAWRDDSSGQPQIYLRRYEAAADAWRELGGSASGGGISQSGSASMPAVAVSAAGDLVVAWTEAFATLRVRRWDAASQSWLDLGGTGGVAGSAGQVWVPDLALDGGGRAVTAWREESATPDSAFLARWDPAPALWAGLGGSASGTGVSQATLPVSEVRVAIGAGDAPLVAYDTFWSPSSGSYLTDVFLRRWDAAAAAWQGLEGSADPGGFTGGATENAGVDVATSASQVCVVWVELDRVAGTRPTRLRCHHL